MRLARSLSALAACLSLCVAPIALAQSADKAQQPKAAATAPAKALPKSAEAAKPATKIEGATAVRTTPADSRRSGEKSGEKSYDGCGSSKMTASDA